MVAISFFVSSVLAVLYFYNIPSAVAIRMIPRPIRRGVEEVVLAFRNFAYLPYLSLPSKLPAYEVTIDPSKLNEIYTALPKEDVELLDEGAKDSKRATVAINGKIYDAKFGIHGDTSPHWLYEKKSWQVKIEGENPPENLRELMFIVPLRRFFITEQFNNYRAKKLGLIIPESTFANLKINGKNQGVYFVIEGWSEDFLRRVGISTPTNLYGERAINEPVFEGVRYWKKFTTNTDQKFGEDFGELRRLLDLVQNADDETFKKKIFSIVDEDNFYAWYVHSLLSGSTHQDWAHNLRIYFDRGSGKLKFIPWDVGAWGTANYTVDSHYSPLISRVIQIPEFREKRDAMVYNYVSDPNNVKEDLKTYDKIANAVKVAFYKDPAKEFPNSFYDSEVARYRGIIEGNFRALKNYLEQSELKMEIFPNPSPGLAAVIDVVTVNPAPLRLEKFAVKGRTIIADTNRNSRLDPGDASFRSGRVLYSHISPTDPKPSLYLPFAFGEERYRFFVMGAPIGSPSDLEIEVKNVITSASAHITPTYFSGLTFEEVLLEKSSK
mgnify:CR=1 FL=1